MSKSVEQLEKENKELQWELKQVLEDNDNYQKQIEVMKNCENCINVFNKNVWDILEEEYEEPCCNRKNHNKWKLKCWN